MKWSFHTRPYLWIHALASYAANSSFQDSLMWVQLETQFVFIIRALKLHLFYCYVTLFCFPSPLHTFFKMPSEFALISPLSFHHCVGCLEWIAETENAKWDITPLHHTWILVVLWIKETCAGLCLVWEHACQNQTTKWPLPNTCRLTLAPLKFSVAKALHGSLAENPISQPCWVPGKLFWKEWPT